MSPDASRSTFLTRAQVRDFDRRASEEFGLPGVVLMENAGRAAAEVLLRQSGIGQVLVCCGRGNNGGDGFVIARYLELAGVSVRILSVTPLDRLSGDARTQALVAERSGLPIEVLTDVARIAETIKSLYAADWIVDALLGTGARGPLQPPYADYIAAINRSPAQVLAVDVPSGLDCDTGHPLGETIRADQTVTFVALKPGFILTEAQPYLGHVTVVGIGAPQRLLAEYGLADNCRL